MVNNFKQIRELLSYTNDGDFYFLQILKRRKDNPGMLGDSIVIDNYFIYSVAAFDFIEDKVIKQCEINNARAYIRLNKRNAKKVAMKALQKTVDYIAAENYRDVKNAYISACGDCHSDDNKTWIVDIDDKDTALSISISNIINNTMPAGDKIQAYIPTRNGIHIITKPFNVQQFTRICESEGLKLDLHKDNPTILYAI